MRKRNPRLDHTVREALGRLLETEFGDPRLSFVTVTEVQVSQDAREALVYWSVLDPDLVTGQGGDPLPRPDQAAAALDAARPRLQALLSDHVRLRNTPVLRFEQDPVRSTADRVETLLREVRGHRGR